MLNIGNQRPGVYSRYDTSSAYASPRSAACAAVVAKAAGGETGRLYEFTGITQLTDVFPPDMGGATLRDCVQILLKSGVSKVYTVAVEDDFYEDALALVEEVENIGAVICDCVDAADLAALKASVQRSSDALRERIAYCGIPGSAAAIEAAGILNNERVVLCCPSVSPHGSTASSAVYGAAALAGRVLAENNPTWNFSGEVFSALHSPAQLCENEVQALLEAGVTVFEQSGGVVECVRALTTRTKTAGQTDYALRGLNAILCIDNVMCDMRGALKAILRGARLSGQSLGAIRSQVAVVLADKKDGGVIESYDSPSVYSHDEDPSVCVVELAFQVAHVVSQIHVTAHIQI